MKKNILKKKGVTGLSKMKSCDLDQALHEYFSEEELAGHFHVLLWTFYNGIAITPNTYLSAWFVNFIAALPLNFLIVEPIARFILSSFQKPFTGKKLKKLKIFKMMMKSQLLSKPVL